MTRRIDRFLALGALAAVAFYWLWVERTYLPNRWVADLQYWWIAGDLWWEGMTPYGDSYLARGQAAFATFIYPFFYPPWSIPFMAGFPLVEPALASRLLLCFNLIVVIATACYLSIVVSWPSSRLWQSAARRFALIVVFGGIFYFPSVVATMFGSLQFMLLAGLLVWIHGARRESVLLQGIGIAILMLKPQYGAALGLCCFIMPRYRMGAIASGGVVALLFILGGGGQDPIGLMLDWVANTADYASFSPNAADRAAGLGWIGAWIGYEPGVIETAGFILSAAAVFALTTRLREPVALGCMTLVIATFFYAGQFADFVLLIPLVSMLVLPAPLWSRAIFACGLFLLAQSHWVSATFWQASFQEDLRIIAGIQTPGLILAFFGASSIAAAQPAAPGRAAAASLWRRLRADGPRALFSQEPVPRA
ncbi:MAG: glycosyltransferase 87 family protein [Pseudomonadota bacterium]